MTSETNPTAYISPPSTEPAWGGEGAHTVVVPAEQAEREQALIEQVVASFEGAESPRLKQLMQALVRHLHAFTREVRLSEQEWERAIQFLTEAGHITTQTRQEFVLLSDTLGVSMQTIAINNEAYRDATEATVFGPFFVEGAPLIENGADMAFGAAGQPCWVEGRVTDTEGHPVAGARIEVWEADEDGFYDVQYGDGRTAARAHLFSEEDGSYRFWGITPTPYPIPYDGPVGQMLQAVGRSPMRTSHVHFMVSAEGSRTLVTHIFVDGCDYLDRDSVFGVKQSLIMDFAVQPVGTATPDGRELGEREWARVRFDIVLAPAPAEQDDDLPRVAVADASGDEQQLRELEGERYQAMERGDADAVAALCHPDLTYAHSSGERDGLADLVQKIRDRHFVYGPIDHPIDRVIVNGSAGIVVGHMRARVEVGGQERQLNNSAVAVWTKTDSGWRLLAYQPTPLQA